jgi:hypothetical protein
MKHFTYILFVLVFISFQSTAFAEPITKKIKVGNFHSLEIGNAFEVHVVRGNNCVLTATGNEDDLDELNVNVAGSTLAVSLEQSFLSNLKNWKKGTKKIVLTITMPSLRSGEFSGASKVSLEGFVDEEEMSIHTSGASHLISSKLMADKLILDLSGAAKVNIKGQVLKLSMELSGASHVILSELVARDVDVNASGASHIELNVQKSLHVDASGASKITYLGNPVISKDLSGASTVRQVR